VAGAWVGSPTGRTPPIATDLRGQFAIAIHDAPYSLVARHGDQASEILRVNPERGKLLSVTLTLGPTGIAGVVVDGDGAPIPGAEIWRNPVPELGLGVMNARAIADAQGRFSFDLPRGTYRLSVRRSSDDDFLDEDDVHVASGTHDLRLVLP